MPDHIILRCTVKLLKEIDIIPSNPPDVDPGDEWCLNLLHVRGKKCVLMTHQKTLFTAFVPEVRRAEIRKPYEFFLKALSETLAVEGLCLEPVDQPPSVTIARTNSRMVLGSMNDLAFQCLVMIDDPRCTLRELRRRLNRIRCRP